MSMQEDGAAFKELVDSLLLFFFALLFSLLLEKMTWKSLLDLKEMGALQVMPNFGSQD